MKYQACCPKCGVALTRSQYFSTLRLHFRCGVCGAHFQLTVIGLVIVYLAFTIQFTWAALCIGQFISGFTALNLSLLTWWLGGWLLPFLTPTKLRADS